MSKDRLLSDDGLRAEIANILLLDRQTMEPYVSVVDDLINLVNTQKRLYAESIKEDADDMAQFIAALLIQSGGSVEVTNRTLKEMHYKLGLIFERFDDMGGNIEFRLKKED